MMASMNLRSTSILMCRTAELGRQRMLTRTCGIFILSKASKYSQMRFQNSGQDNKNRLGHVSLNTQGNTSLKLMSRAIRSLHRHEGTEVPFFERLFAKDSKCVKHINDPCYRNKNGLTSIFNRVVTPTVLAPYKL